MANTIRLSSYFLLLILPFTVFPLNISRARDVPPPVVTVVTVQNQQVNPGETYVGRVEAIQSVDLRARVQGYLEQVKFKEGSQVKAGDLLYVIEQAPYQAEVNEEQAIVAEAEASIKDARQYLKRLNAVRSGGVSATDLETAANKELKAAAVLKKAKANLEKARINLDYTAISAPISGQIGRTAFTRGNLVGPESGSLARIVQLDPIRVVYAVSENRLEKMGLTKAASTNGFAAEDCPPVYRIQMPGGDLYPLEGHLDFVDNQVDSNTGTIAVRAVFENPNGFLVPGQYVTVITQCEKGRKFPMVPQSAVQVDRQGRYVFVVDNENRVQERRIETGAPVGTDWIVRKGLLSGERVISDGIQKVQPGQAVKTIPTAEEPLQ